jgi:hypothetical protein
MLRLLRGEGLDGVRCVFGRRPAAQGAASR